MTRTHTDPLFVPYWLGYEAGRQGWPRRGGGAFSASDEWPADELAAWDEGYAEGRGLNPTGELRHR